MAQRVTMVQDTKPGYLAVWLQGPGSIWCDDFSLREVELPPFSVQPDRTILDDSDRVIPVMVQQQGGRTELVQKEQRELDILQAYVQAGQISDDEIRAIVSQLVAEHGNEFRKVMPLASKETRGRADGKRVNTIVREMTQ